MTAKEWVIKFPAYPGNEVLQDCIFDLSAAEKLAEKAEKDADALREDLIDSDHYLQEARAERDRLRPLAIGGDGDTHWYYRDECERLQRELEDYKAYYSLAYDRDGFDLGLMANEPLMAVIKRIEGRQQHGKAK